MHCLYFVKVAKENANTREETVDETLGILEERGFVDEDGKDELGKCDWFKIGGRWSGVLSEVLMKADFETDVYKFVGEKKGQWAPVEYLSTTDIEAYGKEIQNIWETLGGPGLNPYSRNRYLLRGYADDVLPLTSELIDAIKRKCGEVEFLDCEVGEEKKASSLSEKDIGDWFVVIDYHF